MPTTDEESRSFRDDLLGHWVCTAGRLSLRIERDRAGALLVTVWRGLGRSRLVRAAPARYEPPREQHRSSPSARARLGYLCVELAESGLGPTYDLMFAGKNADPSAFGGYEARPLSPDDAPADVLIFPEPGASFLEAVLGPYDDVIEDERSGNDWMLPLGRYRWATAKEDAALAAAWPLDVPRSGGSE